MGVKLLGDIVLYYLRFFSSTISAFRENIQIKEILMDGIRSRLNSSKNIPFLNMEFVYSHLVYSSHILEIFLTLQIFLESQLIILL